MNWTLAIWPDRAQYRPGAPVTLLAEVTGPAGLEAEVRVRLTRLDARVADLKASFRLDGTGSARVQLVWQPPAEDGWTAYGVDAALVVQSPAGQDQALLSAHTAFDIAPHWRFAPRYGFLSDFRPGSGADQDDERLTAMLRLHLTCIQFYDWMYTHYDYIPPQEIFTDVLGRTVDFGSVRRRIRLCREKGMAPIAYGSVYGAEKEFSEARPDWLLYDGAGRPMQLAGLFFIQDPSAGSGWREYLLSAYRDALELGFAGIHCDTYGSPKAGLTRDGRLVRMEQVLPGLMAGAQALAEAADPAEGGSMFNNVKAWPLEAMARAPGAAIYIEVWDPDKTYRDLWELVMRVRHLDRVRQPILAAYLSAFFPRSERPAGAMAGLRLASATIFASGGFHLLPGEGAGILAHAYYPDHGRLSAEDWEAVRSYWDFQTRYGPILADPAAADLSSANTTGPAIEARFRGPDGVRFSAKGAPGSVWTILKEGADYRTVHLLNLTEVESARWNSPQPEPPRLVGLTVQLECLHRPSAVWWASPDVEGGRPLELTWRLERDAEIGQVLVAEIPSLHFWSMLVVQD